MIRAPLAFLRDLRGAAAMEMALWLAILVVPVMNVVDLGFYTYQRMQVEAAAQAGAQAAWTSCVSYSSQPKGTACGATLATAVTTAVHSTSLGSSVDLVSGYPTEGPYCPDSSNQLQLVATYKSSCAASGYPAGTAGDYIQVSVTYTYRPLFGSASVVSLLPTPIVRTAWTRLG